MKEQQFQLSGINFSSLQNSPPELNGLQNQVSCKSLQNQNSELVYCIDKISINDSDKKISKKSSSGSYEMEIEEVNQARLNEMIEETTKKSIVQPVNCESGFPSLYLLPSQNGQKPIKIKIPMYKTKVFFKLQTQIFILDITDPNEGSNNRQYTIQRRFSDFYDLYTALFYNQPGYILFPFPDKSFGSFFKIKLGVGFSQAAEKCSLIERRMGELQKFVNFITHHPFLRNSQEISIFLHPNHLYFQQGMKRLEKFVEEYMNMQQKSQMQSMYEKGKSLWKRYFTSHGKNEENSSELMVRKNQLKIMQIQQNIMKKKQKITKKLSLFNELFNVQKNFSQFTDFKTQNDSVLNLCAKQSSSRQYCLKLTNLLQIKIIEALNFNLRILIEADKIIAYRNKIKDVIFNDSYNKSKEEKLKLERRLEVTENNFLSEWHIIEQNFQASTQTILQDFNSYWAEHKGKMRQIWKLKK